MSKSWRLLDDHCTNFVQFLRRARLNCSWRGVTSGERSRMDLSSLTSLEASRRMRIISNQTDLLRSARLAPRD